MPCEVARCARPAAREQRVFIPPFWRATAIASLLREKGPKSADSSRFAYFSFLAFLVSAVLRAWVIAIIPPAPNTSEGRLSTLMSTSYARFAPVFAQIALFYYYGRYAFCFYCYSYGNESCRVFFRSLRKRNYPDNARARIIVVDNRSTDNTRAR